MSDTPTKETHRFETEVTQLLDLMIHSLYSNKEIFLRELISNASDAADRLRFEATTDDALFEGDADLHVYIEVNEEARTISIRDNGIGMNHDEVIANIGTIASSGTRQFFDKLTGDSKNDAHLIGQFGVGFYSSFLIADHVTLVTRRAGLTHEHGVRWESTGDGNYTIETVDRAMRGTEITLHLREDADEFLQSYRLRTIINKYADHIPFPIRMSTTKTVENDSDADIENDGDEEKEATTVEAIETVNQASALWTRPKSELNDDDYINFYKHVGHDFEGPMQWIHQRLEGKYEYTLLLYLPKRAPFDLWQADGKHGVKLYVRRVFIMEASEDLLPKYLRFMRGVMDTNDLPLNVSREILQHSPAMEAMKKGATKRVLGMFESLAKKEDDSYHDFWKQFGNCMKEGIIDDFNNKDRLAGLLRFASAGHESSTDEQTVSLATYIARMAEGQDKVYYITAESLAAAKHSPHLEIFRKKGIEVLLMHDRIDEWLISHLHEFDGKSLQSIAKGELDLSAIGDKEDEEAHAEQDKAAEPIAEKIQKALADKVKSVRVTHRLTASPACLISDAMDMSINMERILKEAGQSTPDVKPILEINPEHVLITRIGALEDEKAVAEWAAVLFDQAVLAEGALPEDPAGFVRRINAMLAGT
ncbi:MAG: molecular chaperone HtpG [Mariprofundaceae bacterium]|nr:molecular chaperone HtpG [Mariprofundaceae bacterium]